MEPPKRPGTGPAAQLETRKARTVRLSSFVANSLLERATSGFEATSSGASLPPERPPPRARALEAQEREVLRLEQPRGADEPLDLIAEELAQGSLAQLEG